MLRPGLTATVRLRALGPEGLIIPLQSLIDLGDEARVISLAEDGSFVPKDVKVVSLGREEAVVSGDLAEGESLVVGGLFLIDSEANLRGALDRLGGRNTPAREKEAEIAAEGAALVLDGLEERS
jgi:Cu(I)/Ag(I) efflux system membrane fusion protein